MMKRAVFLGSACGILLPYLAIAQLPYTSTNAVPWHLERTYDVVQNLQLDGATMPITTSGTEVVWDFSGLDLPPAPQEVWYFEPASVTPYQSTYPSANVVAWFTNEFGNNEYLYLNNSPFELRLLGAVYLEDNVPLFVQLCPDPFLIMDYPMGIGSGVQQVYNCPGAQGEIDSWVILATGRIVYNEESIDDVALWRSIFTGPGYADTSYFWTQYDNVLYPVARYNPGANARIRFPISETILNTNEISAQETLFDVYPNPATDVLTIRSSTVFDSDVSIIIYDVMGRKVKEIGAHRPGDRSELNVNDLPGGTYLIELRQATGAMAQRRTFVKE